ncbi:hypothetical protein ACFL2Z_03350 [Candidatus Eisenbacteria bacterium]|uniref:Type IX secretion system membrane protein PorP/SprF n=1 Tax=Eiseniibacteriota bacterium TaxID=2212470 RepID=A0ABV6YPD6_UNCEI
MKTKISLLTLLTIFIVVTHASASVDLDSTLAYRDAFLPPGVPSIAVRTDETAMLWNPAGLAFSGMYFLGYAWKGTYYKQHQEISTHFFLTKAGGFGIGYTRDSYSKGTKNQFLISLAPPISKSFSVGVTNKWKGAYNLDAGAWLKFGNMGTLAFVWRDLRDTDHDRKTYEAGLGIFPTQRVALHFDVIIEDNSWRTGTTIGGGLYAAVSQSFYVGGSYFKDGDGNGIMRAALKLQMPGNVAEGEFSKSSDDYQTYGIRMTSFNQ